jgi:hypothetical protein
MSGFLLVFRCAMGPIEPLLLTDVMRQASTMVVGGRHRPRASLRRALADCAGRLM